jgi:hypothetical protein
MELRSTRENKELASQSLHHHLTLVATTAIRKDHFMTNQPNQTQPDQKQQGGQNDKSGQQSQSPGTETKQPGQKAPDQK